MYLGVRLKGSQEELMLANHWAFILSSCLVGFRLISLCGWFGEVGWPIDRFWISWVAVFEIGL